MFCKHDWEVISKDLMKSPFEIIAAQTDIRKGQVSSNMMMYQQKLVTLVKCKKCGRLKEFVNVNPAF